MVNRDLRDVSVVRQCELLNISRSSVYYSPVGPSVHELELMGLIDKRYLRPPFYGSRKLTAWLRGQGYPVSQQEARAETDAADGHRGYLPPSQNR